LRLIRLFLFIRKQKIDTSICQSSFYLPIISWLLAIPSTYTNDNEHAKGNMFGFIFARRVILPEVLKNFVQETKLPRKNRIQFYRGIKESIYLSNTDFPDCSESASKSIFYRPEPITAQYYKGPLYQQDELLIRLSEKYRVVILPRGGEQLEHYKDEKFKLCTIVDKPLHFNTIVEECDLFIGGGGSMTRELAVLGKKVISTYGGKLLAADIFLIEHQLMRHLTQLDYNTIDDIMSENSKKAIKNESAKILNLGKIANHQIYNSIFEIK